MKKHGERETDVDKSASSNKLSIVPTSACGDPTKEQRKKKKINNDIWLAEQQQLQQGGAETLVVSESNDWEITCW